MATAPDQPWVDALAPEEMDEIGHKLVTHQRHAVSRAIEAGFQPTADGRRRFELWCSILTRDWPTTLRCLNAGKAA
jgi:hypothetical protein